MDMSHLECLQSISRRCYLGVRNVNMQLEKLLGWTVDSGITCSHIRAGEITEEESGR